MSSKSIKIIVVLGPTASGKSDLAVRLARIFSAQGRRYGERSEQYGPSSGWRGAEIISADSRQVYRGLDVGSGKITKREMRGVPHHLINVASPRRTFTVARYQRLAHTALRSILRRGKLPIVVGGTGFYIDALLYDYALPAVKPNQKLRKRLEKLPTEKLFTMLRARDPRRARTIDRYNRRRLVRALEIVLHTGKPVPPLTSRHRPYSNVLKNIRIRDRAVLIIGIRLSEATLKRRIRARLLKRMPGMIREVKKLHARGLSWKRLDDFGLEYRYVSRYLTGLLSKKDMAVALEREIHRYAKRQRRWWRRDKTIVWLKNEKEITAAVRSFLRKDGIAIP